MDNKIDYRQIGARLRNYRHAVDESQLTLANSIHYSPAYISQIECGKANNTSLDVLIACCEYYGRDLSELISGDAPPASFKLPEDILFLLRSLNYKDRLSLYVMAEAYLKINPPGETKL